MCLVTWKETLYLNALTILYSVIYATISKGLLSPGPLTGYAVQPNNTHKNFVEKVMNRWILSSCNHLLPSMKVTFPKTSIFTRFDACNCYIIVLMCRFFREICAGAFLQRPRSAFYFKALI